MALRIFTIGYEGATVDGFVATLKRAGITRVLDVRELPLSRRRGFSKSALSALLAGVGVEYQHERALGAPRHIRHRLREDRNLARYFVDFREYLGTLSVLLDALAHRLTGSVALLCYERDPKECHRSVVADALAKRLNGRVQHLHVSHDVEQAPHAPRAHSRQSLSATE
jgi:uncharacterized protein (DUF488 family)